MASSTAVGQRYWPFLLTCAAILMITMGARQCLGLYVSPLNTATGLGIVSISFALAVGQFVWGAAQPVFGALADRYGSERVVMIGGLMMAAGIGLTPFVDNQWFLMGTLGFLVAAGAGAGSFSILIGATAGRLPPEKRAFAAGFINAGGSFGQFLYAPLSQFVIASFGWVSALLTVAATTLLTLPLARVLRASPSSTAQATAAHASHPGPTGLRAQLREAMGNTSYWCLHAGFFTCGFHVAFLVTHLPGEVQLCGLPGSVAATSLALIGLANIAGSLSAGYLGGIYRMKWLLFWVYATRAVAILLYLMAPKTAATFFVFAVVLGFTWLSTVPPTAGLVGKLFGTRHLATLFGLTLLSHQIGGFFGAWLGGLALVNTGSYDWMWYADIALAALAAVVNLPIRETPMHPRIATA